MQLKVILKWLAFIGAAVMVVSSVRIIFLPDAAAIKPTQSIASVAQASLDAKLPVRLKIPSINVDAAIESLGLAPDGTMDVPNGPNDVAWFDLGPRPGEIGNAVMSGHFGWKDGISAVFDDLSTLKKGDILFVEDSKGTTIAFVVRESRLYDPEADASDVFNSNDGKSHLNLVTCEGVWDESSKSYSKRLVVFADKKIN